MMIYLLKANFCLSIFLIIYWALLRRDTFYRLNRIYFLWAMMGTICLPLLDVSDFVNQHQEISQTKIIKYIPDLSFRVDNQTIIQQKTFPNPKIYLNFGDIFQTLFLSGMGVLLCKLIVQLISVFRFLRISTPLIIRQTNLRNLSGDVSPFSFFGYIFINIHKHSEEDLAEIIAHESAHARQFHSVDVMLIESFCVLFWVNPLAWAMRKFLKQNLEFLTDKTVIDFGFDVRHYQYNLLKINGLNTITATNNFNFSDLKLRIKMMNRERSSKLHLLKYFLTIPLGAILILAFNISRAKPFNVRKSVMENVKEMVESVEFERHSSTFSEKREMTAKPMIEETDKDNNLPDMTVKNYNTLSTYSSTFNFTVEVLDKSLKKRIENAKVHIFGDSKVFKTNFQGIAIIELKQVLATGGKTYVAFDSITSCPSYKFWVTYNNITSEPVVVNRANHRSVFYYEENKLSLKKEVLESEAFRAELNTKFPIEPKTKWFYCKEDIIKELERTQELPTEKRPLYKINGTLVATDYNWNNVSIYSILNLEYWSPEDGEKLVSQFGTLARNGIYNLNILVKQTTQQRVDLDFAYIAPEKPLPKIEKCTPSADFPTNALYIINGKMVDSGYLHKHVKPEEIEKMEVMATELAKIKYGEKGKKGVILISTKKIDKLEEK